jgi:integrase/recombinase XerC
MINKSVSFRDFFVAQLEKKKLTISNESYLTYKTALTKIIQFKPDINFGDLNEDLINAYRQWMLNKGNNENTVSKSLRTLRTFTNLAVRYGVINNNPFQWYRIKKVNGKRQFMTKGEFNQLYNQYLDGLFSGIENDVIRLFLFSCTTGLRYGDLKKFSIDCIENDVIKLRMHKTGYDVSIPLSSKAKQLLGKGIKVYCNKVTNRYLKKALQKMGYKKKITFHVARHTFATISVTLGMPIEVVSKLLGHTDIKTTQIYAKVVDDVKIKEMAKWNF